MSSFITEDVISDQFRSYLQEMNINVACEQILDDLSNEDLSKDEVDYVFHEVLMPEVVIQFAEKYDALSEIDPSKDLNTIFETFCAFEGLSGSAFKDLLAAAINGYAATEDEDDDNEAVFKPTDWDELSDDARQAKVKAFLKKIANAHLDARDMKPFMKNLDIGDQPDPYGNKFGEKVKTFDRDAHRLSRSISQASASSLNQTTVWRGVRQTAVSMNGISG